MSTSIFRHVLSLYGHDLLFCYLFICVIFLRFCAIAFWWCYPAFSVAPYPFFVCSVGVAWLFRFFLPGPSSLYIDGPGKATCWSCVSFILLVCFEVHMHWLGQHGIRRTGTIRRSAESAEVLFHHFFIWKIYLHGVVALFNYTLRFCVIYSSSLGPWLPDADIVLFTYPHSWNTGSNVLCLGWLSLLRVSYVHQGFVLEFDWYLMCFMFQYEFDSTTVSHSQFGYTSSAIPPTWQSSVSPARHRPVLP